MLIQESYINRDTDTRYGNTEPYEPFTDDLGALYRSLQREYGRCTGHVYIDRTEAQPQAVGWVFLKRVPYEGHVRSGERRHSYLREVWVTCYEAYSKETRVHRAYATVGRGSK